MRPLRLTRRIKCHFARPGILAAIGPGIHRRHAAVRIDIAVLPRLLEMQIALIVSGPDDEECSSSGQLAGHRQLAREPEVFFDRSGAVDQPEHFSLPVRQQGVGQAPPVRKRGVGGICTAGGATVAGSGQRIPPV